MQKAQFKELIEAQPPKVELTAVQRTEMVKDWKVADLLSAAQSGMKARDFHKGKQYFTEAGCYKCHRFRGDGGNTGPDLTAAGTRFDHQALLESIIEPSKTVSDQYQASQKNPHWETINCDCICNLIDPMFLQCRDIIFSYLDIKFLQDRPRYY